MKKKLLIILAALVLIVAVITVVVCINKCASDGSESPAPESTTEFSTPALPDPDDPFNGEDDILT